MSTVQGAQAAVDEQDALALPKRSERVAAFLVSFIFAINVAFLVYMITQFWTPKPYSTGLHVACTLQVLVTTGLLGLSARSFWMRKTRIGCYLFFGCIGLSFVCNLITGMFV